MIRNMIISIMIKMRLIFQMINVFHALKEEKMKSRLILQVHDELLLEVPLDEAQKAEMILREQMIKACDLAVRMEVDLHTGKDWYEAK